MNIHVPYTQAGRMMAISSVLGEDALLLEQLTVDEAINDLFTIKAEVKSQRDDLRAGDLIGSSVDFSLKLKDGGTRWWNGFVTDLHQGSLTTRGTRSYLLTVRPTVWRLLQTSDCRIFRGTTAPQIVETLLGEHGITDLELRVTQTQTPLDYSVQWNETDLAYMLRRMQQMGLFYWFEHDQGRHTMIVADHQSGYRDSSEPEVRFTEGSAAQDHINRWNVRYAYTPGKRAGRDWNFLAMQAPHGEQANLNIVPGSTTNELYEYPGRFDDSWSAEQAMKYRIQATETGFETVDAASTVRTLAPGRRFTPHDVAKPSNVFAQQVVTAIRHEATNRTYETNGGQPTYANTFAVMPATTPATPHRTIPRPSVVGTQIAMIAGPEGEEIFCDQWGRIKVWFPWDRRAAKDGSDTCWIRVGQPWAGTTWGHQVIPRVGMEALVSYQDGDPDRPFVTALVPDPTNPTPYPLPDNKTRVTFRSNSYKSTGFNEMTFEDATGAENMFFHAQKDHTTRIENNQTMSVGNDHSSVVGRNQALTVGQNLTWEVGSSYNIAVGATGGGVAGLMAPFATMSPITSSLLGQALATAAAGASANPEDSGSLGSAQAGRMVAELASLLSGHSEAMIPPLADSLIGLLGQTGQQAQQNVWSGSSPRPDAGTALAAAGGLFGQAAGTLFNLPGMHNHITGTLKTEHHGCARVEQVGTSKVTHVGSTYAIKTGSAWNLSVGSDAIVKTGGSWSLNSKYDIVDAAGQKIIFAAGDQIAGSALHLVHFDAGDKVELASKNAMSLAAKTINITADDTIVLTAGDASITLDKSGKIQIKAGDSTITMDKFSVTIAAAAEVAFKAGKVVSDPMVVPGDGTPKDTGGFFQPDPNDAHPMYSDPNTGPLRPNKVGDIFSVAGKWLTLSLTGDNKKAGDLGGLAGKWFGEGFTGQLNTGYETFKHMFTPGAVQTVPEDTTGESDMSGLARE